MKFEITLTDILVIVIALSSMLFAVISAMRRQSVAHDDEALAGRELGPWVLGLSAAATANTGFVLTGAVGMGYGLGASAIVLPISWFLGDLLFWYWLAPKINERARGLNALTLPGLLEAASTGHWRSQLRAAAGLVMFALMMLYLGAQLLSAGKVASAIFDVGVQESMLIFAAIVTLYTVLSGFRGAVYTDVVQSFFMIALAIGSVALVCMGSGFDADRAFSYVSEGVVFSPLMIVSAIGFAIAAFGFNLGQPQMVTRWMAGASPDVLRKARWIYMISLQLTWLTFTAVGVVLAKTVTGTSSGDQEQALMSLFLNASIPGAIGLLLVGAFSTIASSAASGLAVGAEMLKRDIFFHKWLSGTSRRLFIGVTAFFAVAAALFSSGSVFDLAFASVSLTGAAFGSVVLFLALGRTYTAAQAGTAIVLGSVAGLAWKTLGWNSVVNEAAAGLTVGLLCLVLWQRVRPAPNSKGV